MRFAEGRSDGGSDDCLGFDGSRSTAQGTVHVVDSTQRFGKDSGVPPVFDVFFESFFRKILWTSFLICCLRVEIGKSLS